MKKHILLYNLFAALLACMSCQEQDMMHYEDTPAIYFANNEAIDQRDSISYTFFTAAANVKLDTVRVLICAMGVPVDYDRPIMLLQTNTGEPDAAIAGTHYVPFDDPALIDSFCIPAGEVQHFIPIVVIRDKSLATEEVRLEMELKSNEHFRPGIDAWRHFLVKATDTASKPTNWDTTWKYHFGASWGPEKMRFIIQYTGFSDFDNPPSDYSYLSYLGNTAKQALIDYNAAHPNDPLCEADGTPISFDN